MGEKNRKVVSQDNCGKVNVTSPLGFSLLAAASFLKTDVLCYFANKDNENKRFQMPRVCNRRVGEPRRLQPGSLTRSTWGNSLVRISILLYRSLTNYPKVSSSHCPPKNTAYTNEFEVHSFLMYFILKFQCLFERQLCDPMLSFLPQMSKTILLSYSELRRHGCLNTHSLRIVSAYNTYVLEPCSSTSPTPTVWPWPLINSLTFPWRHWHFEFVNVSSITDREGRRQQWLWNSKIE